MREFASITRLPRLIEQVRQISARLNKLEKQLDGN
jgi:hypothetical protein